MPVGHSSQSIAEAITGVHKWLVGAAGISSSSERPLETSTDNQDIESGEEWTGYSDEDFTQDGFAPPRKDRKNDWEEQRRQHGGIIPLDGEHFWIPDDD